MPANPVSHGRYLVMNFCSECHGQDLEGWPVAQSPSLTVAKGYSLEQFSRLMQRRRRHRRPHVRAHDADVEGAVLAASTPDEISAMHAYLQSRG